MQRIGYVLLGLVFVVLALYLTLPTTLPPVLDLLVQRALPGWQVTGVKVGHPDLRHWYLDYLVLENGEASLSLNQVGIQYAPPTLAQGYVENLHIGEAKLSLKPQQQASTTVIPPLPPRDWLRRIPSNHLKIDALEIDAQGWTLQGQLGLDLDGGTLDGQLKLDAFNDPFDVQARLTDAASLDMTLSQPREEASTEANRNQLQLSLHWLEGNDSYPLRINTRVRGHWQLPQWSQQPIDGEVVADIDANNDGMEVRFAQPSAVEWPLDTRELDLSLPPLTYLNASVGEGSILTWDFAHPRPRLNGDISLTANFPDNSGQQLVASLEQIDDQQLGGTILLSLPHWFQGKMFLDSVHAALPWSLVDTDQGLQLQLDSNGQINMGRAQLDTLQLAPSQLNWPAPISFNWNSLSHDITLVPASLQWRSQGLQLPAAQLKASAFDWTLQLERLLLQPEHPVAFNVSLPQQTLPLTIRQQPVSAMVSAQALQVANHGNYNITVNALQSSLSLAGDISDTAHTGTAQLNLALAPLRPYLNQPELRQLSGQLSWSGQYNLTGGLTFNGRGELDSDGEWDGYPAWSDFKVNYRLQGSPDTGTLSLTSSLPRYELLGIKNFRGQADIRYNQNRYQVALNQLGSDILDGNIRVNPTSFSYPGPVDGRLLLSDMSLAAIMATHPSSPLQGQGRISGTLPFHYDQQGLRIEQGYLSASGSGGKLSYTGNLGLEAMSQTYPQLASVSALLGDFHFNSLDANVDYAADGKLLLQTHLEGSNPAFEQGRAVNFNISVEENLLQLLRSLQVTGKLNTVLGERIQQQLSR